MGREWVSGLREERRGEERRGGGRAVSGGRWYRDVQGMSGTLLRRGTSLTARWVMPTAWLTYAVSSDECEAVVIDSARVRRCVLMATSFCYEHCALLFLLRFDDQTVSSLAAALTSEAILQQITFICHFLGKRPLHSHTTTPQSTAGVR